MQHGGAAYHDQQGGSHPGYGQQRRGQEKNAMRIMPGPEQNVKAEREAREANFIAKKKVKKQLKREMKKVEAKQVAISLDSQGKGNKNGKSGNQSAA